MNILLLAEVIKISLYRKEDIFNPECYRNAYTLIAVSHHNMSFGSLSHHHKTDVAPDTYRWLTAKG
jgi:hypothetical protein